MDAAEIQFTDTGSIPQELRQPLTNSVTLGHRLFLKPKTHTYTCSALQLKNNVVLCLLLLCIHMHNNIFLNPADIRYIHTTK